MTSWSSCQAPKLQIGSSTSVGVCVWEVCKVPCPQLSDQQVENELVCRGLDPWCWKNEAKEWVHVAPAPEQKLPPNFSWGGIKTAPLLAAPSHPKIHFQHCVLNYFNHVLNRFDLTEEKGWCCQYPSFWILCWGFWFSFFVLGYSYFIYFLLRGVKIYSHPNY